MGISKTCISYVVVGNCTRLEIRQCRDNRKPDSEEIENVSVKFARVFRCWCVSGCFICGGFRECLEAQDGRDVGHVDVVFAFMVARAFDEHI